MLHERSAPAGVPEADLGAWDLLRALAGHAVEAEALGEITSYAFDDGELRSVVAAGDARWVPEQGWQTTLPAGDPQRAFIELYLPICSATPAHPLTVGHLGQSLDGFIATHSGDSQFVTGEENMLHMHRMRALCDAVVVGAGTVAADDPQLTTRHVSGPSPMRVVFDPTRRLRRTYRVFHDDAAPTLYVCARSRIAPRGGSLRLAPTSWAFDEGLAGSTSPSWCSSCARAVAPVSSSRAAA